MCFFKFYSGFFTEKWIHAEFNTLETIQMQEKTGSSKNKCFLLYLCIFGQNITW
uniref:Uncharacterized protein n=1 Tax=Kuenenia stuttgartiensis TaxID=174633 RepID=Q1PW84_KUEST|nr:unknown protein [Candidatus Kuenenia stuttgartiensis]